MSLNSTPSAERVHIGIFGRRNAGKSSLLNALTGQNMAIVSDVKGTTTDPVSKAMELLPLGPVVMIDTPGIDDEGELGGLRVKKSYQVLNKTDLAVLVIDAALGLTPQDEALLARIRKKEIPCLVAVSQCDLAGKARTDQCLHETEERLRELGILVETAAKAETGSKGEGTMSRGSGVQPTPRIRLLPVSAATGENIYQMKELLARMAPEENQGRRLVGDLIDPGDFVLLVVPIDKAAPKGRLILPQQQTIRDILESGASAIVVRDTELADILARLEGKVRMVITDSQAFGKVGKIVPEEIPLTSFSILFARYKGELEPLLSGIQALEGLADGDTVLISEGCTHHRQCNDIGTVKIPGWLQEYTGKQLNFRFTSGGEFPDELAEFALIVHCGGCMLNAREMRYRIACARDAQVPITNYGMLIAHVKGLLARSIRSVGICLPGTDGGDISVD